VVRKTLAKLVLKLHGWKIVGDIPPETKRCVLVAGPHTSNWDFYFAAACMFAMDTPMKIGIKDFYMKFPLGPIIRYFGGVGVNLRPDKRFDRKGQVAIFAELFEEYDNIAFIISPEGNRTKTDKWKTGFFRIAELAQVPIVVAYLDHDKKEGGFGPVIDTKDGLDNAMMTMIDFYEEIPPCIKGYFQRDKRYPKV